MHSFIRTSEYCFMSYLLVRIQTFSALSLCPSVRPSICPHGKLGSHSTIFHKSWYFTIFRKFVKQIQVSLKPDKNNKYFTWRLFTFVVIPRWIALRSGNVSDACWTKNQTHFILSNFFFWKYGRLWDNLKNIVQPDRT